MNGVLGVISLGAARLSGPKETCNHSLQAIDGKRHDGDRRENPTLANADNGRQQRQEQSHRIHEKIYWIASVIIGLATLGTAIAAARFALLAYNASNDQAITAKNAFIETDRPIFDISFIDEDALGEANAYKPKIKISAENIGSKPGYVRYIGIKILVDKDVIGDCPGILGSRLVASAKQLSVPCVPNTLNKTQVDGIRSGARHFIVTGKVNYRSLTGYCWNKNFRFFWVDKNEFLPAHMVVDILETANAETSVECDKITIGAD